MLSFIYLESILNYILLDNILEESMEVVLFFVELIVLNIYL